MAVQLGKNKKKQKQKMNCAVHPWSMDVRLKKSKNKPSEEPRSARGGAF